MSCDGTSLLEVVFALALSATVGVGVVDASRSAAAVLGQVRLQHEALNAARNLLEGRIATACNSPVRCPGEFRCSFAYDPLLIRGVDANVRVATRIRVHVVHPAMSAGSEIELTTVVAGSQACG